MKKTRFVILGLLQEEELSGYEIKKIINIRMSFFWQESYGQIYPELSKLKEEGLIEYSDTDINDRKKHDKLKYKITSKGDQALRQWMEAENEKDTARSEFLLKLYLSTEEDRDVMCRHIQQFMMESEQKRMLFRLFEQELKKDIDLHNNHRQILKVLNLGLRQAELYVTWSKEMLEYYKTT